MNKEVIVFVESSLEYDFEEIKQFSPDSKISIIKFDNLSYEISQRDLANKEVLICCEDIKENFEILKTHAKDKIKEVFFWEQGKPRKYYLNLTWEQNQLLPHIRSSLKDSAEISYWVENLLPKGVIVLLVGKPKIGKTNLALQLVRNLVTGEYFLEHKIRERPKILFCQFDESSSIFEKKLKDFGFSSENLGFKFLPISIELEDLAEIVRVKEYGIVIIDNLSSLISSSSNESYALIQEADLMKKIRLIRNAGATVILIHSPRKKEEEKFDINDVAGTYAISGNVDIIWSLKEKREGFYELFILSRFTSSQTLTLKRNGIEFICENPEFSDSEQKIYNVLLNEGKPLSATEIIKKTNVPKSTVHRVLNSLEKKGVIYREKNKNGTLWCIKKI